MASIKNHRRIQVRGATFVSGFRWQAGADASGRRIAPEVYVRVSTLMKLMNIHAMNRKPNIRKRLTKHPVSPYLLRTESALQSNHACAADIIYIPMRHGFVFLFAAVD